VTAVCYGLVGVGAHYFFKNRSASVKNFLVFGVPVTLIYDAVTMFIGPIFENQPLILALAGQVPFTLMHLLSTIVFATLLSPLLYRWVVQNEMFEFSFGKEVAVAQK
jgi:hypothetical protein